MIVLNSILVALLTTLTRAVEVLANSGIADMLSS